MDKKKKQHLYEIAVRCFRNTADQDYIHARLAYENNLIPQFLWSSLHCLEKYSKCMMVANGNDVRKPNHKINFWINRFEESVGLSINLSTDVKDFIKRLDETAKYRYMTVSSYSVGKDIYFLDKAVHEIRRYCQQFSFDEEERKSQILELSKKDPESYNNQRISLDDGHLERILTGKDSNGNYDHLARNALIHRNVFFSPKDSPTAPCRNYLIFYNSPFFSNPELFKLARKYIYIENIVETAYNSEFGLPD